jgi:protein-disulfide isomerase
MLEKVVKESKGKACLYFKQFPIKSHPRALMASKACVASDAFGKFWEYCSLLFRINSDLSDKSLMKLAERSGLDPAKLKLQMEKDEVLNRIADEKMEGLKHRITGTPAIFVNGKKFLLQPNADLLRDRIEEELDILNGRD